MEDIFNRKVHPHWEQMTSFNEMVTQLVKNAETVIASDSGEDFRKAFESDLLDVFSVVLNKAYDLGYLTAMGGIE